MKDLKKIENSFKIDDDVVQNTGIISIFIPMSEKMSMTRKEYNVFNVNTYSKRCLYLLFSVT